MLEYEDDSFDQRGNLNEFQIRRVKNLIKTNISRIPTIHF